MATDYEGTMAVGYDTGRGLTDQAMRAWEHATRPMFATAPAGPVMDLGAGTGRFSGQLHQWSGALVVPVEPAREMGRRLRAKSLAGVAGAVQASAEALPFTNDSMSTAWLSQVVHHIDDLEAAASELHRVLRANALVFLRGAFGKAGTYGDGVNSLLYHYFPEAQRNADQFPKQRAILNTFGAAGFVFDAQKRVEQITAPSLRQFYGRTALRADSTLAAIDDDAFARGLAALRADAEREHQAHPVVDTLDLLVLRRP